MPEIQGTVSVMIWSPYYCTLIIFCIFEINSKILSLVVKNIQASLVFFHSFIRIFAQIPVQDYEKESSSVSVCCYDVP